jgi:hypothetical protein
VAKLERWWLSWRDGWLSWLEKGAKLVAHLLAAAALWVRIQTSAKNTKMGDVSKGVANTLIHKVLTYTELCLAFSKLLTPHTPLHPASVSSLYYTFLPNNYSINNYKDSEKRFLTFLHLEIHMPAWTQGSMMMMMKTK